MNRLDLTLPALRSFLKTEGAYTKVSRYNRDDLAGYAWKVKAVIDSGEMDARMAREGVTAFSPDWIDALLVPMVTEAPVDSVSAMEVVTPADTHGLTGLCRLTKKGDKAIVPTAFLVNIEAAAKAGMQIVGWRFIVGEAVCDAMSDRQRDLINRCIERGSKAHEAAYLASLSDAA